jgi:DNA-binding beta-propeller fold protein YncE
MDQNKRALLGVGLGACLALSSACGSTASSGGDGGPAAAPLPTSLVLTADWLHHTVSLVDFDAVVNGGAPGDAGGAGDAGATDAAAASTGAAARAGEIDLSSYAQGPYMVKITPDGKSAVVSLSPGFFSVPGATILVNAPSLPTGPSRVLVVDLASRSIQADLDTGDGAAGIAITPDGHKAFISHAGTSNLSVVDLQAHQVLQQIDLGGTFAEDLALDDSGTVGVVTYLDPSTNNKSARAFAAADPATLSAPIPLGSDAGGVAFFPGTKKAFVVRAYNPLTSPASGYALIDASNPAAPVKLAEAQWTDTTYITFEAIPAPARGTVLVPAADNGMLRVREYGLGASDVVLQKTYDVVPTKVFGAFDAVVDAKGRMVLTMPGDRQLAVLDLASGNAFAVPWFAEAGPMGIALR